MGCDRGDSFPFDFEPNGFPFGSKSKGKLSPRSYPIECERKWKYSFLSEHDGEPLKNHHRTMPLRANPGPKYDTFKLFIAIIVELRQY